MKEASNRDQVSEQTKCNFFGPLPVETNKKKAKKYLV